MAHISFPVSILENVFDHNAVVQTYTKLMDPASRTPRYSGFWPFTFYQNTLGYRSKIGLNIYFVSAMSMTSILKTENEFCTFFLGNVRLSEGGEVLKRFCEVEAICLQALMSDALSQFVPHYFGHISQDGERYIRLEDLLSGLKNPVIMDCKMGVR